LDHPDGHAEEQHSKEPLDGIHPRAGLGQEFPGGSADQEERRTHADAQGEQGQRATYDIARLADDHEGRHQRGRDAGRDDKGGEGTHDRRADVAPGLLLIAESGESRLIAAGTCNS